MTAAEREAALADIRAKIDSIPEGIDEEAKIPAWFYVAELGLFVVLGLAFEVIPNSSNAAIPRGLLTAFAFAAGVLFAWLARFFATRLLRPRVR